MGTEYITGSGGNASQSWGSLASVRPPLAGTLPVFFLLFAFLKKVFLSLQYAESKAYTRFEKPTKGLRYGDLGSCLNADFAEGLSPDVTLFSFPRIRICQVSFSNVLLRLISSDDNQCLDGDNIQDDKLLTVRREIGYSESRDTQRTLKEWLTLNHRRGCYI